MLRRTTEKEDDGINTAVIVVVVIICILVLVIAIVGLLLLKRYVFFSYVYLHVCRCKLSRLVRSLEGLLILYRTTAKDVEKVLRGLLNYKQS